MNTDSGSDTKPSPTRSVTPPPETGDVGSLRKEYEQRIRFATMDDDTLFDHIQKALRASYRHRGTLFHETHITLDLLSDECNRRQNPSLFDKAFRVFSK